MNVDQLFEAAKAGSTDFSQHMDSLRFFAEQCRHVTEFGVRGGCSTAALLAARPKVVVSYDVNKFESAAAYQKAAAEADVKFHFIMQDCCARPIEVTELLFIDTIHTYAQLDRELRMHAGNVRRWIILHDTYSTPSPSSPENSGMEMWIAILKLLAWGDWALLHDNAAQNGFTVLERKRLA